MDEKLELLFLKALLVLGPRPPWPSNDKIPAAEGTTKHAKIRFDMFADLHSYDERARIFFTRNMFVGMAGHFKEEDLRESPYTFARWQHGNRTEKEHEQQKRPR